MAGAADRPFAVEAQYAWALAPVAKSIRAPAESDAAEDTLGLPLSSPTVALVHWGNLIEDFLEPHGLTLERYCSDFRGSWIFGYVEALRLAGVRSLLVLISKAVDRPTRLRHEPTGAPVLVLPPPLAYRVLSRRLTHPYARHAGDAFGLRGRLRSLLGPILEPLREVSPYLATPVLSLARDLRRLRCQALICQEYEFPRFDVCAILSRRMGIPVFGVFQGGDYQRWRSERISRPLAMHRCQGLVCPTSNERRRVQETYSMPAKRIASIPNPIDCAVWSPGDKLEARASLGLPAGARVAVWHGRVEVRGKGLDVLLDAWSRIQRRLDVEYRLLVIGDGADAAELHTRIVEGGFDDVVFENTFIDNPEKLKQYLVAGDVYVFSSRHEGFPLAPVEAMACGLPTVVSDVSGIREIFPHGEASGALTVRRDDPKAFAEAVDRLFEDEDAARSLGARARLRAVENFSVEAVGRQLRRFFLQEDGTAALSGTRST